MKRNTKMTFKIIPVVNKLNSYFVGLSSNWNNTIKDLLPKVKIPEDDLLPWGNKYCPIADVFTDKFEDHEITTLMNKLGSIKEFKTKFDIKPEQLGFATH